MLFAVGHPLWARSSDLGLLGLMLVVAGHSELMCHPVGMIEVLEVAAHSLHPGRAMEVKPELIRAEEGFEFGHLAMFEG